ncbi:hypothetical protein [Trinickia fusca]|nr:hypothetical protein [Trinickia fusca]
MRNGLIVGGVCVVLLVLCLALAWHGLSALSGAEAQASDSMMERLK